MGHLDINGNTASPRPMTHFNAERDNGADRNTVLP